jgi:hypothetical protein
MIISHRFRYVYVGIPRTGSKSMNRWLMDHYAGEWVGTHHQWQVPPEAQDYLIFTLVRNPYERAVSGWFHIPWVDPPKDRPLPVSHFAGEVQTLIAAQAAQRAGYLQADRQPTNQREFVEWAGVSLVLYHEALPGCLTALPFVDPTNLPPFPHREEAGKRPPGTFFDIFRPEDEPGVWELYREDFATFGYRRHDPGGTGLTYRRLHPAQDQSV